MIAFEDWIHNERYQNVMTKYFTGTDDLETVIEMISKKLFFVGLFEHYDESLVLLRHKIGNPDFGISYCRFNEIRIANRTIDEEILSDPQKRALLEDMNRTDINLYKFVVNEIYPCQKLEYGNDLDADVATFKATKNQSNFYSKLLMSMIKRNLIYKPWLLCHEHGRRIYFNRIIAFLRRNKIIKRG